jgi:hypothetical protein
MRLVFALIVAFSFAFTCAPASAQMSTPFFVEWHGSWWAAHAIGQTSDGRAVVHYDGWGKEWDEAVDRSRILHATLDGKLFVEWHGSWWAATAIGRTNGGALRVHYDGWGAEWDETVDASRVQRLSR